MLHINSFSTFPLNISMTQRLYCRILCSWFLRVAAFGGYTLHSGLHSQGFAPSVGNWPVTITTNCSICSLVQSYTPTLLQNIAINFLRVWFEIIFMRHVPPPLFPSLFYFILFYYTIDKKYTE